MLNSRLVIALVALLCTGLLVSGCSRGVIGGAALGGAGAAAAYEYQNREAMEDLNDEYERGEISREEYERRKEAIEERSLIE